MKTNPNKETARLEAKRAKKELKAAAKAARKSRQNDLEANLETPKKGKIDLQKWQKKGLKVPKTPKEKVNVKEAIQEFPVKMIKEVNKIKWSSSGNLTKKYISVLLFMVIFALFFALVDWGLQALFSLIKIV
ncbi:preprotein translocase subunit SecE [Entomoplasma freundtii]|uniref:Preprotein translocase subunit SecE n=1 Tax=Entomoplasma freundtii TaxID=74700 RepID=A0A2K8NT09_9MOLU|nr:preprotein translocase subunit SecE [Entomoplasma freundtii]ATZ16696.1 preprotein translocase subunit SecE [Entomoplasma freundtii]TDY58137.1 preprotein translocase subunit SecE [Entomoplasma freundtii]